MTKEYHVCKWCRCTYFESHYSDKLICPYCGKEAVAAPRRPVNKDVILSTTTAQDAWTAWIQKNVRIEDANS